MDPTLSLSFERLPRATYLDRLGALRPRPARGWHGAGLGGAPLGESRAPLLTIVKVFLHDVGDLRDLYRVASLAGLAVSLLPVSIAYERFVFRTAEEKT